MLKRREIEVLRRAGHTQTEIAKLTDVSRRSVQRLEIEARVIHFDAALEREPREIDSPSKAEPLREFVMQLLTQEPELLSVEISQRRDGTRSEG